MRAFRWLGILVMATLACNLALLDAPTATPLPTNTPAPPPTLEPVAEAAGEEALPQTVTLTQIEILADGSTHVTDSEMGYVITLPAGWLVLDGSDPDVAYLVDGTFEDFPELQNSLGSFFAEGGVEIRMAALDAQDVEAVEAEDAFMTLGISQDPVFAFLDLASFLALYQQALPDFFPSAEVLSVNQVQNPFGVDLAVVDLRLPLTDQFGQPVELYQKQVFFKASGGLGVLNFSVSAEQRPPYKPIFEGIADTLALLE